MISIQEQNIMKLTINGKWDESPGGEKEQAVKYAEKNGYDFSVHPVTPGLFRLIGSKVML